MKTEIPSFLAHLKIYGDYPVPFTQMWIDDKPDFRVIDPEKVSECVEQKLCAICGRALGEFCFFIGGERSAENSLFLDPPMHEDCAEYTAQTCPFVSGERAEYSHRPINEKVTKVEAMASAVRPREMFILKSRTKKFGFVKLGESRAIQAGRPWIKKTLILTLDAAIAELLRSEKFKRWPPFTIESLEQSHISVGEKHFTPQELAEAWGVSAELVRQIFRSEKGVLKIGKPGTKYRRPYLTLRIPESVAEDVHRRLSE